MEIIFANFAKFFVLFVWLVCLITSFKQRDSSVYLYAIAITAATGAYQLIHFAISGGVR